MDLAELEKVVSAVGASKKYQAVCPDTIRRIAAMELAAQGTLKAATKSTKRRLHQVYGAFESDWDHDRALGRLETALRRGTEAEIKAACRQILEMHSSTRERLPILDLFYTDIFAITGRPSRLLDVGCGLNPLALPWMDLFHRPGQEQGVALRYVALDIDAGRVHFLNRCLALMGLEPLVRCQDALSQPPQDPADVALLLKMSPTLERQGRGATVHLIEELRAPHVVVSFAVRSLGGREKGMAQHYQDQFAEWVAARGWPTRLLKFDTELVFVIHRQPGGIRIQGSA